MYGVIPSGDAASNTWRCKRSSYFEDSEPSHEEQTRTTSEEMIVLALEHAKLLTVERPKTMRSRHDEASNSTSGRHSRSPTICPGADLQTADCDSQAGRGGLRQQQQRQRQQRVEDNNDASEEKCVCDGDNKCDGRCSRVASTPALFEDIKLIFTGSLLMSKATVQLNGNAGNAGNASSGGGDREADSFAQGNLLPDDDAYMFNMHSEQHRTWRSDASRYSSTRAAEGVSGRSPPSNVSSRLGRCAVVGNSGALLNYKQGNASVT